MNYLQRAREFKTKKRLGQNFLIDANVISKIIEEADISKNDIILEIGPGAGFITEELAKRAKKVIAIELDKDAVFEISKLPFGNIEIINEDILKVDISTLCDVPLKVVANIPYYITSPIIAHLLGEIYEKENKNRNSIKEIILMVQYEVAQRIVANQNSQSKEYGLLSILSNFWAETNIIQKVPARAFYPSPKVDSALVKFEIQQNPAIESDNLEFLHKVIKACFGTRRKNIKNALKNGGFAAENIEKALLQANIAPTTRGEKLGLEEFSKLAEALKNAKN
ncbi:MAG: 16S rRNA (adenine(1518)-N(6)/adenine(1519)-N(6))-dimethyltransferase RsmA [Candidatus Gastranaerophilales bacterium]|nr:16S rRNA (adenine(1518)-N(6)/adenine(1519)-N(6))-dimethyltransferase RsmA [Candidatus Gastranaerophilales bacterium]